MTDRATLGPSRLLARVVFVVALSGATWLFLVPLGGDGPSFPGQDKVMHAVIFAMLTLLALLSGMSKRVLPALIAYGVAIEIAQGLMPFDRHPEALDLAADTLGIVAVIGLWTWVRGRKST